MPSLSAMPASHVAVGAKPPGDGADAIAVEDARTRPVDHPLPGGRADASSRDDDIELGGVLAAEQRDEVRQGRVAADQLYVHSGHSELL